MKTFGLLMTFILCAFTSLQAQAVQVGTYTGSGNYGDVIIKQRGQNSIFVETCATYGGICHTMRGILSEWGPNEYRSSQASLIVYYGNRRCTYDVELNIVVQNNQIYLSDYAPQNLPNNSARCPQNLPYADYIEPKPYTLKELLIPWDVTLPKSGEAPLFKATTLNKTKQASFITQCYAPSTDLEMMLQVNDELWLKADQAVNIEGRTLNVTAIIGGKRFDLSQWEVNANNLFIRLDTALVDEVTALKKKNRVLFDLKAVDSNGNKEYLGRLNFSLKGSSRAITRIQNYCAGEAAGARAILK